MEYKPFHSDSQMSGQTLASLLQTDHPTELKDFLAQYDLKEIQPEGWYPTQICMDWCNKVVRERGEGAASSYFVAAGMNMADQFDFPSEFYQMPLKDVLGAWGSAYPMTHRGTEIGDVITQVVEPTHLKIDARMPFPDDFIYGGVYALARRFLPRGSRFTVQFDKEIARRDTGGERTIIHLTW